VEGEVALHSNPTILERALQALQEYQRGQSRPEPMSGLQHDLPAPPAAATPGPILPDPSLAQKDAATSQIFRWVGARCARRQGIWSSEKSLWRDYVGWSQQHEASVVPRDQFGEMLDQIFMREMDGWWGIALGVDIAAERYVM
jgi:hypothetical protein